jgi:hypothetical protein
MGAPWVAAAIPRARGGVTCHREKFALKFQREGRSESLCAKLGICRSIKAQRIRGGDFLFKAQASVSHKIEPLNDPVSVRRDKGPAPSVLSHPFAPVPHQNHTCLTQFAPVSHQNRTCLTQFAPVPHQNHACLTQFSLVSKNTEPVVAQPFGPLARRSPTLMGSCHPNAAHG